MIEEPGSFSGIDNSANPARGPQDTRRMSLAILQRDTARVRRVASCMWVRPIFTMSFHAWALALRASRRAVTAGIRRCFTLTAAAIFMAVGNVSFDDCAIFTSSFGCTGVLLPSGVAAIWQQRLEITSFTFIWNWVPLPVIHTCNGNMS